jgi:putative ABC transport system substrate-binding protein
MWVVASYLGAPHVSWAEEPCIAVLYPQVSEPYRVVLEEIMTGIEQGTAWTVRRVPVPDSDGQENAQTPVVGLKCRAVIGLGRAGMQAAAPFVPEHSVVAGAVLMSPGQAAAIPTISFVPDSAELFTRLKHFLPSVRAVTVVFDPDHSGARVASATKAAENMGIRLVALEARNLREAAVLYERALDSGNSKTDAIWLMRDASTMDSGAVLTLVLERAWKKKLVIFSDQLAHVKNGVLFSVYPDNEKLGARLAKLAQACATSACDDYGVMPLQDLGTAVNKRTANRLDIDIDRRRDPYVGLVFPTN